MYLKKLRLTNFRNYETLRLDATPGIYALVGLNGSGKTNVLEAIHFLCMTRCSQSLQDAQIIKHGAEFLRAEAGFENASGIENLVCKIAPGKKKVFELNGKAYEKLSDHIGRFPVVMVAPDDQSLIMEGSESRRRFLDTMIAQMDHEYLHSLMVYNRVLKHRNAYLKESAASAKFDPILIKSYNQKLCQPALHAFETRNAITKKFNTYFEEAYRNIAGDTETASVEYYSPLKEKEILKLLEENLRRDRMLQRTSSGIHKDDLMIKLQGKSVKKYASQGQRKSLVLALRFAQYAIMKEHLGSKPLLLLDDIFDKLDIERVSRIFKWLGLGNFDQVWITDTEKTRIELIQYDQEIDIVWLNVKDGRLIENC